jgi:hypothetical protein
MFMRAGLSDRERSGNGQTANRKKQAAQSGHGRIPQTGCANIDLQRNYLNGAERAGSGRGGDQRSVVFSATCGHT